MKISMKKILVTLGFLASSLAITTFASASSYYGGGYDSYGGWGGYSQPQATTNAVSYANAGPGGATAYSSADTGYGGYGYGGGADATSYANAGPGGATAYSSANYTAPVVPIITHGYGGWGGGHGWGHGWGNNGGCNSGCNPPVVQPKPCWWRNMNW